MIIIVLFAAGVISRPRRQALTCVSCMESMFEDLCELYGVHAPHVDVNRVLLDVGARVAVTATKSLIFHFSIIHNVCILWNVRFYGMLSEMLLKHLTF